MTYAAITPTAPVLIAIGQGYFKKLGLDVETTILSPTAAVVQGLASGSAQVGQAGVGAAMWNLIDRGVQVQIVSSSSSVAPASYKGPDYVCFVARPDAIERLKADPKNLRGMTVAVVGYGTGSTADIFMDRLVTSAGLTLKDINPLNLAISDVPAALSTKKIDLGWSAEPNTTRMVNEGLGARYKCLSELDPGHVISYMLYAPAFGQNQQAARYFMLGYLQGVRDYDDAWFGGEKLHKRLDLAQYLAPDTKIPAEVWASAAQAWFDPNGALQPDQIMSDEQGLVQLGFIQKKVPWQSMIVPDYAEWATKTLGKQQV